MPSRKIVFGHETPRKLELMYNMSAESNHYEEKNVASVDSSTVSIEISIHAEFILYSYSILSISVHFYYYCFLRHHTL